MASRQGATGCREILPIQRAVTQPQLTPVSLTTRGADGARALLCPAYSKSPRLFASSCRKPVCAVGSFGRGTPGAEKSGSIRPITPQCFCWAGWRQSRALPSSWRQPAALARVSPVCVRRGEGSAATPDMAGSAHSSLGRAAWKMLERSNPSALRQPSQRGEQAAEAIDVSHWSDWASRTALMQGRGGASS